MRAPLVVRPGDRVRFEDRVHTVVGMSGVLVRLADEYGGSSAMHLPTLMTSPGFQVLGSGTARTLPAGVLDSLPRAEADKALWWHRHMAEVLTGLAPDALAGARPRPEYDPETRTLGQREAAELTGAGHPVSAHAIRLRRRRYQRRGVEGMIDGRPAPRHGVLGQVDPKVAEILRALISAATDGSTHTVGYFYTRLRQEVAKLDGPPVAVPSRATFYRLERGRQTTGSARTRRSLANQPAGCSRRSRSAARVS